MSSDSNGGKVIKLHLTQAALNSLIEAQPEIKLHLGQQVVERLAKTHVLNCIGTDPSFKQVLETLKLMAQQEVARRIGEIHQGWQRPFSVKLNPDFEAAVKTNITQSIQAEATRLAMEAVVSKGSEIDQLINSKIDYYINQSVKDKIKERVDAMVKQVMGS